jgi:hypothetical protein
MGQYYSDRYSYVARQVFIKQFLHSERLSLVPCCLELIHLFVHAGSDLVWKCKELQSVLQESHLLESDEPNHYIVSILVVRYCPHFPIFHYYLIT